jgi:AraC family transcriptional regulator
MAQVAALGAAWLTWHGMAAETAKVREPCRIEVRFHAPVHLLILFEEGARGDGVISVEGPPRSGLRNYKGKLVLVPADHEYYDRHRFHLRERTISVAPQLPQSKFAPK